MRPQNRWVWFALIPLVAGALAMLLFLVQGGFGAGHGRFDQAIGVLGLPSILLVDLVELPDAILNDDLILVIWFPALMNSLLWGTVALFVSRFVGSRSA